ncbi:MAG: hypothetical protein LBG84_07635 [Treponema sp.]|jgi:hypothetical protein|nr:hypothetical protein [Treponema sp.]
MTSGLPDGAYRRPDKTNPFPDAVKGSLNAAFGGGAAGSGQPQAGTGRAAMENARGYITCERSESMKDYLDLTDTEFDVFFNRLVEYLGQKCAGPTPTWTHIPSGECAKLEAAWDNWHPAYESTLVPHTAIQTKTKNDAKAAAKNLIRSMVNRFLREDWEQVKDEDRIYLAIPIKDKTRTVHPVPALAPDLEAAPAGPRRHRVTAINPERDTRQKPDLVKGVAFGAKIRSADGPVTPAEDLPSVFQTKTVREYQYPESEYGKVVDYACAYENETGQRGPWSNVVSVIIA